MKKPILFIPTLSALLLSFTSKALAFSVDDILSGLGGTPGEVDDLIIKLLNWMIGFGAVICVVMLVFAGYSYMTAGGDEGKVKTAQKTLTNAIIGLVICFIAVMLVNFVLKNFLGQAA